MQAYGGAIDGGEINSTRAYIIVPKQFGNGQTIWYLYEHILNRVSMQDLAAVGKDPVYLYVSEHDTLDEAQAMVPQGE